ncbi:MAG: hypothetical protein MR890_01495 [Akkermansia muciniphila]|nr:hypothetical protein [Akkermansia muciniphila]
MRDVDADLAGLGQNGAFLVAVSVVDAVIRAVVFLTAEVVILLSSESMFDNEPAGIEQDDACIFSGIIGGEVLKKLENVGEYGMLGVFSHDGVFLFWFLKEYS